MNNKQYLLANVLLVIFLTAIAAYFRYSSLPLHCNYQVSYNLPCHTCGISRDLSQFLHLNFSTPINPHSYWLFAFGVLFFISRILHSAIAYYHPQHLKKLLITDAVLIIIYPLVVI
ncbi:DUF2752 domain-containing protein [Capnocytophaga sp. oral taxon 878]|uniref:DUF2752 domain-containing protein n=1 Tax=Capnocytophaga sp. oral taxon 878 TaxID=1316596 RepID=UPI000D040D15|nr:DUF2752 domain-containing protein [Capnocytophaga sp. oral taxon 878]AVM50551.1 hypothetical protein C4H12_08720 [Capnocytophaga sp. oral taxon 878]